MSLFDSIGDIVSSVFNYKAADIKYDAAKKTAQTQLDIANIQKAAIEKAQVEEDAADAFKEGDYNAFIEAMGRELDLTRNELISAAPSPIVTGSEYIPKGAGKSNDMAVMIILGAGLFFAWQKGWI